MGAVRIGQIETYTGGHGWTDWTGGPKEREELLNFGDWENGSEINRFTRVRLAQYTRYIIYVNVFGKGFTNHLAKKEGNSQPLQQLKESG